MKTNEKRIACVFEDVNGYYVCDSKLDYLVVKGYSYKTKRDAMLAARNAGYTHAVGSGTYCPMKVTKIDSMIGKEWTL